MRQHFGSTADFYSKSTLTYIHHARVKAKLVIVKAVQGTCLRTNWCEVLLLHKSEYFIKDKKGVEKVSLKLNENYLDIPSVSTTESLKINQSAL